MDIPKQLETKRLILRPYVRDDINAFLSLMRNELVTRYLQLSPEQKTYDAINLLFDSVINSYNNPDPIFALAIIHKNTGEYIGSCGLNPQDNNAEVECFYTLLPQFWGNGFAIEAMKKIFEYAFSIKEILKIVAYINPKNSHSWRVAERIGMKYLGHIPNENMTPTPMFFSIEKIEYQNQWV